MVEAAPIGEVLLVGLSPTDKGFINGEDLDLRGLSDVLGAVTGVVFEADVLYLQQWMGQRDHAVGGHQLSARD